MGRARRTWFVGRGLGLWGWTGVRVDDVFELCSAVLRYLCGLPIECGGDVVCRDVTVCDVNVFDYWSGAKCSTS